MAVVGLGQTFYSTPEDGGSVEVCVVVYMPDSGCPIKFPFTVLLSTEDFSAGIYCPDMCLHSFFLHHYRVPHGL